MITQLLGQWIQDDHRGALAWAEALDDPRAREIARGEVLGAMLAHHPAEALEAIGDDPKFFKQPAHMRALRDGMLGDESFSVLLEWAVAGKPGSAELIDSLKGSARYHGPPDRLAELVELMGSGQFPNLLMPVRFRLKSWPLASQKLMVR